MCLCAQQYLLGRYLIPQVANGVLRTADNGIAVLLGSPSLSSNTSLPWLLHFIHFSFTNYRRPAWVIDVLFILPNSVIRTLVCNSGALRRSIPLPECELVLVQQRMQSFRAGGAAWSTVANKQLDVIDFTPQWPVFQFKPFTFPWNKTKCFPLLPSSHFGPCC